MPHIGLVSSVQIGIVLRRHIAAAAPVFIAHTKIINLPGLLVSVFLAQIRHGGDAVEGHVLHPFAHLLHCAASHVSVHIGLTAKLLAKFKKLVGAEAVVLHHAAPVGVYHLFTVFFGADAVPPVVLVRKTAARPTQ